MKKIVLGCSTMILLGGMVKAQTQTAVYKPGPAKGENIAIRTSYGVSIFGHEQPEEERVQAPYEELFYMAWTFDGSKGLLRSLIRFADMDTIPATAKIISAQLKMYGVASSSSYGNSSYPGSPYATTNEGYLKRVTGTWKENTVTWNSQPTATAINQVEIAASDKQWSWDQVFDVTEMVKDIRSSGHNYGFLLQLQNEIHYRGVIFASCDNPNPDLWPELEIQYAMPTSVGDLNMELVKIFPNPADHIVTISGIDQVASVSVYTMLGQLVKNVQLPASPVQLTLSDLAAGTYVLQISNEEGNTGRTLFRKQ